MESQITLNKKHKIVCDDRKNLIINGIVNVDTTSETQVVCEIAGSKLMIFGKDLHVKKLDVNEGVLEIDGQIEQVKYTEKAKPFLKRLFK